MMTKKMQQMMVAVAAAGVLALAASAGAATVTWEAPVTIGTNGDLDVSTQGTLVGAYTVGGVAASTTVNGVPFTAVYVPSYYNPGNQGLVSPNSVALGAMGTLATRPGFFLYGTTTGEAGTPTGLTANYQAVVSSDVIPVDNGWTTNTPLWLTLNNLTVGHSYLFQSWMSDCRAVRNGIDEKIQSGGSWTDTIKTGQGSSSNGQYVIGMFTADATTQTLSYEGGLAGQTQVNAMQLREIPIPEPAALALLGLGGMIVGFHRRNRK